MYELIIEAQVYDKDIKCYTWDIIHCQSFDERTKNRIPEVYDKIMTNSKYRSFRITVVKDDDIYKEFSVIKVVY